MLRKIYNIIYKAIFSCKWENPSLYKIYEKKEKPFENLKVDFEDGEINKHFIEDNKNWFHNEHLYLIKNICHIEPGNMIVIVNLNHIIWESTGSKDAKISLTGYLKYLLKFQTKIIKLENAILFDNKLGSNYFHFFSDILSKIYFLDKFNIDQNLPLIVSNKTFCTKYFQYIYNHTELKNRNWIVQDDKTWIKANNLYLVKPLPYNLIYWQNILHLLNFSINPAPHNRIFITRSKARGRYIKNMDEIEAILTKYSIKSVDTDNMDLVKQADLFSNASLIISIHGAGNANLMFTNKNKVRFLEIIPNNRISCHYFWLSTMFGINYVPLKGCEIEADGSFYLSPQSLENLIIKML